MPGPSDSAYKEFLAEAEEHIESLYEGTDQLDSAVQEGKRIHPDLLNAMFRAAHSLKGAAGMFGFETLSKLSHDLENVLDDLRMGKRSPDPLFIARLYDVLDSFRKILAAGEESAVSDELRAKAFEALERLKTTGEAASAQQDEMPYEIPERITSVMTEYEEHRLKENIRLGMNLYIIKAVFDLEDFDEKLTQLTDKVKEEDGEVISTLPSAEDAEPGKIKFELLVGTSLSFSSIKQLLSDFPVEIEEIAKKETAPSAAQEPAQQAPDQPAREEPQPVVEMPSTTPSQFLRVEIYRLDEIMNVVGELFMAKTSVSRLLERWKRDNRDTQDILELERIERQMDRNLNELRERIMEIRMVPVRSLFDRLIRAAKKLSREMQKNVDISYSGEETKLDKFIIEELMDPLMHIIRNSIDHGLEPAEERIMMGKPEVGRIFLRAYQRGSHVVIEVEDDGRGIDIEKIRKKAVERGFITPEEVVSEEDLLKYIFMPGFSTKDEVSMVSGRGVGLDVVADKIRNLRGLVEVKTEKGKMTRFILTLPMTLAIIQALLVKVGDKAFGIPITSVLETIEYHSATLKSVEGKDVLLLREETIPVLRLEDVFGFSSDGIDPCFIIITGVGERKVGIPVTDLMGRSDVVIKSLGEALPRIRGIAGAADLGEDNIVLVLDIASLVEEVGKS